MKAKDPRAQSPDQAAALLLSALRDPQQAVGFSEPEWDLLLRVARREGLLPRLAIQLRELGALEEIPAKAQEHLSAGAVIAADHERMIRWEVDRIQHAVSDLDVPVVLLKGAAYVAANLPPARGRLVSDVDILVPEANLRAVEAALMAAGWDPVKLDPYDQRYYRRWMHELPPLRHRARHTIVDVHHRILPQTSRLKPDPEELLREAAPLPDSPFKVLAPADMVLHSAAHLFHDGDLEHGLRDLVDLHDLLRHFAREPAFWEHLAQRAHTLDLQRPLFYALRHCKRLLGTPVPGETIQAARVGAPPWPVLRLMDALVTQAMMPAHPDAPRRSRGLALWLLYVRSHYLRMPLYLLIPHLIRKGFQRHTPAGTNGG